VKVVITESQVRSILRREIVKRMLTEADEPKVDFTVSDVYGPGGGGGGSEGGGSAYQPGPAGRSTVLSKREDPYAGGGIKSGEDVFEAIARIVGTKVELVKGVPDIGPRMGQAIIDFLNNRPRSVQEVTFDDPRTVKDDWAETGDSVTPIEVKGMDGEVEQTINFTPDAEGLLLYLIAVDVAGTGMQLIEKDLAEKDGMLLDPDLVSTLEILRSGIEGYTDQSDIRAMLTALKSFVKGDKSPNLFHTKLLLAKYAADNWTTGEIATGAAVGVGAVLAVAALLYGGAILLAGAAGGSVVGGGLGGAIALSGMELSTAGLAATLAGQTGVLTTLMSAGGTALISLATSSTFLSGTSFAAAAISGWLVADDVEDFFLKSEFGQLAGYLQDPEQLTELSREIRATFGGDETDRALEAFASAVDAVVSGDSKSQVLMKLNQAEKLMVGF
jgi:hypothetical protein